MKTEPKYRYLRTENGWVRVPDQGDTQRAFEDLTVTPQGVKYKRVPRKIDNSEQAAKERERYASTHSVFGTPKDGLEIVSPEFDLLSFSPILKSAAKYTIKKGADKAGFFIHHPNSFTRGIGDEAGLQDLIESQLVRGNPVGTEMSAKSFAKHYRSDRNHFRTIMDNTGLDGIAQRYYNRSLSKEDFDAIKKSAKHYIEEYNLLPKETGKIQLFREHPDPLDGYTTYDDYLAQLAADRKTLANATSFDESGQPLAYFYDDGRNPIVAGHDYAASKYGVRINNASDYSPKIFPGHLHYSMPKAVSLSDPNVELFRRGPFGITIRMKKPVR